MSYFIIYCIVNLLYIVQFNSNHSFTVYLFIVIRDTKERLETLDHLVLLDLKENQEKLAELENVESEELL